MIDCFILFHSLSGWISNHSSLGFEPRLPAWLAWFQTPDNSLYGDQTFKEVNGTSYLSMVKWLWRNPSYSFALRYLSAPYILHVYGDPTIKDNDHAKAGWCFVTANGLFQLRLVKKLPFIPACLYWNFGWNIIGLVDPNVDPKPNPWQATFVFSPRPSGFR